MIDMKLLIENLTELADKSMQERLWVHGDENEMSSFTEAICGVFDDAGLTRALDSGHFRESYSAEAWRLAKILDAAIEKVPEDAAPQEIIESPGMVKVRQAAGRLIRYLKESNAM